MPTEMTHNDFNFYEDLIKPVYYFFSQIKLNTTPSRTVPKMVFKETFFLPPDD